MGVIISFLNKQDLNKLEIRIRKKRWNKIFFIPTIYKKKD